MKHARVSPELLFALVALVSAAVFATKRISSRHGLTGSTQPPAEVVAPPVSAPVATVAASSVASKTAIAPPRPTVTGHDRFAKAAIFAERWLTAPLGGTVRERWRLAPVPGEVDRVARVVDSFSVDTASGALHLDRQEVMRADEVVVAVPVETIAAKLQAAGFEIVPGHATDAVIEVKLGEAALDTVPRAIAAVRAAVPGLSVEPNFLRFPMQVTPNDYNASLMWGLENIQAPDAWSVSTGSATVVVAVIDSGMDITHPDLAPNLWTNPGETAANGKDDDGNGFIDDVHGWDFVTNTGTIIDNDGHGTHVSGTIGAAGDNGQGITGVDWHVQLMPLRAGDASLADSALMNAINYVTAMRKKGVPIVAINASFGGNGFSASFQQTISNAGNAGVLFVAAAGNDGTNNDITPSYPASYNLDSIISVAAISESSSLAVYSDFGPTTVDIAAPGNDIYSTWPGGLYQYLSGTSMATPHVTGAVALVAAANPGLTAAQIRTRILSSVDPVPALAGRIATGGRLNVRLAVSTSLVKPFVTITTPVARVVAMDRRGLSLALTAALQPDHGVTAAASLAWDAPEAPAAVTFSATSGGNTAATFSTAGLYRVRVTATAGGLRQSDSVVVAVGSTEPSSTGLRAWWHFDETSGPALDSSGDNRTGALIGASRGIGVMGQGAAFNGASGNVSFAAPTLPRVTIAGWAFAGGAGDSIFPPYRAHAVGPALLRA